MEKSALNLGLVSLEMLKSVGIENLDALKKVGSIAAFVAVKEAHYKPSLNLLWALEGAISGCHWLQVAKNNRKAKNGRDVLLWQLKVYESRRLIDRYLIKQNKNVKPATALIGVGSNEDAKKNISAFLKIIELFEAVEVSPVYESVSSEDPALCYLNLVIKINTFLSVVDLIFLFKKIEILFGRKKNNKNKKVTLDIDVLTFDGCIDNTEDMFALGCASSASEALPVVSALPRVKDLAQPYVLCPLAKIFPEMKHPIYTQNYQDLWDGYVRLHGNPLTEVFLENVFSQ